MKVAVLLTGLIRDGGNLLTKNYDFFIKEINPDIYIYTNECEEIGKILDFYKPIEFVAERPDCINLSSIAQKYINKAPETNVENCLHMWRKRKLCYDMLATKKYDKIIITRFDCYGDSSIKEFLDLDGLCIPAGGDYREGLFDICAFGNQDEIQYYCNLYNNIEKYYNQQVVLFHPETLLKYHITLNNSLNVQRFKMQIYLRGMLINI